MHLTLPILILILASPSFILIRIMVGREELIETYYSVEQGAYHPFLYVSRELWDLTYTVSGDKEGR